MKEKLSFSLEWESIKNLNTFKFVFRKKMNENVKINSINNYFAWYDLKSEENYKKLEKVIEKKEYFIYQEIFKLIESCKITTTGMKGIIIEIDVEENYHLLEGIANKFFITRIDQRRAEKKVGHGYVTGNLFIVQEISRMFVTKWRRKLLLCLKN